MSARRLWTVVLASTVLWACGAKAKLDDKTVEKYIVAYKEMRKVSPDLAKQFGKKDVDPQAGQAGFAQIEGAIKKAGFSNYAEFVKVNAAIAWAFSQAQAGAFMKETDARMKGGNAEIEKTLKDPHVPEAVKAQLRTQQAQMQQEYGKNKGWADVAMNVTGKLTDEESIQVVMRHRKELEQAFQAR